MLGLFNEFGERPVAPQQRGPGDYVKEKYDEALGAVAGFAKNRSMSFFASGFGKGALAIAVIAIAAMAISTGLAAAAGTLPTVSVGMAMTAQPTIAQGVVSGMVQGLYFLASGGGLLAMAAGGIAGAAVEGRRHPEYMSVAQAQNLSEHYAEKRAAAAELQAQMPLKKLKEELTESKEQAPEQQSSFAARELQRRGEAQAETLCR